MTDFVCFYCQQEIREPEVVETYEHESIQELDLESQNHHLRQQIKDLEGALVKSTQALDDWTSTYAEEFCDSDRVTAAWRRITDNGGTLAYIAGIVHRNHALLASRLAIAQIQQEKS